MYFKGITFIKNKLKTRKDTPVLSKKTDPVMGVHNKVYSSQTKR
jgi:hypothetical protein